MALPARGVLEAASPALATVLRDDFVAAYERELPAVVQCFHDHFDACIAHLRFSLRHRRVIRTTNLPSGPSSRSDVARRSSRTPSGSARW